MLAKYYVDDRGMYVVPYSVWCNSIDILREVHNLMLSSTGEDSEWVYEVRGENVAVRKVSKVRPSIDEIRADDTMCLYSVGFLYDEFMCNGNVCQLLHSMLRVSLDLGGQKGNYCLSIIPGSEMGYDAVDCALIRVIPSLDK